MVTAMLVLFLDPGLTRSLTYLVASGQYQPHELYFFSLWMTTLLSILGGGIFYALYTNILAKNFLAGVQPIYVLLILFLLPVNLLTAYLSGILLGLQEIIRFNLVSILRVLAALVFQIYSAMQNGGVLGAVQAYMAANILALIVVLWLQRRFISFKIIDQNLILKKSLNYGMKSYFANLSSFFNYRLDTFIVNFFRGATGVGLYSTGVATAEILWYIPNSVSGALFPKSATLGKEVASTVTARACRQTLLVIIPLTIIFSGVGSLMIPLVFGIEFQASVLPFLLLLPGVIGLTIGKVIFANLSGRGKPQYATYTSVIALIFTVILDLALIPYIGIAGAAIASSISYVLVALISIYWFVDETRIHWTEVVVPTLADLNYLIHLGDEKLRNSFVLIKHAIRHK